MSCKVIAVVGPTAIGKSNVAVRLAQDFNGAVINGDSVQVYRQLNIGSAKTTPEEMQGVRHLLLDILDIGQPYSVQQFQNEGRKAIDEIQKEDLLPIVCGGTGLYVKALLYDYSFRDTGNQGPEYEEVETQQLYDRLLEIDEKAAEKIHPNNRRRIVRALQMAEAGVLKSEQEAGQKHEMIYDVFLAGLTMDRDRLKERINQRVDRMFEDGLLEEVTALNEKHDWSEKGLQGIGYKEFREYFSGEMSLEEVKEKIKTHTRQFAKRQYTWWNNQMPVRWYDVEEDFYEKLREDVRSWLNEGTV